MIASEVGGLAFLVRDGETGFHVPDRDPEALADRICEIITNPLLRAELGEKAAAYAKGYAWPLIAEKIIGVYERCWRGGRMEGGNRSVGHALRVTAFTIAFTAGL